jgi:predicted metalloprotease with PDZ domain
MSFPLRRITQKKFLRILRFSGFLVSAAFVNAQGHALEARVTIAPSVPEIRIEVDSDTAVQEWSFRNAYAGVLALGERIERFEAIGKAGESLPVRKIASGEYRSDEKVTRVSYSVKLVLPSRPGDRAHVSWLTDDYGFLMFADLLPQLFAREATSEQGVLIECETPVGWQVRSAIVPNEKNQYLVLDPDSAVFFVARLLRTSSKMVESMEVEVVSSGVWPFADAEVLKVAAKVVRKYFEITGFRLKRKSVVMLAPLPPSQGNSFWRAETRGSTMVLLLDPQARHANWAGQLGVIFTHEIFHLWVPNSLHLQGDYDWFFEGFTLYEALLMALDLKLITFQEYLDTISRVYDSYLSYSDALSLIEASEQRWTNSAPLVYDKGMLVAFMYDLITRQESGGKSTLADRYRALFKSHADDRANANEVIAGLLNSSEATKGFSQSYVESRSVVELERFLPPYGIQIDSHGPRTHLSVRKGITKNQQQLLRSLGYKD